MIFSKLNKEGGEIMKKVMLVVAFMLTIGVVNAHAVAVTFNADQLYDWGRLYTSDGTTYTPANSNPSGTDTVNPPPASIPVGGLDGYADGNEDTWGIGSMASINTLVGNNPIWTRGSEELTFMFYGFDDDYISAPTLGDVVIGSKLGRVQVWLDPTPDFNGALGTGGRTGLSSYTGVTDGDSVLALDLVPVANSSGFTLQSTFDFVELNGSGNMYLAVSGAGLWDAQYNTNSQAYGSDIWLSHTVRDNATTPTTPSVGDWIVRGDLGGEASVVPEPMTMLMVAMGALGFGVTQRKRKKTV